MSNASSISVLQRRAIFKSQQKKLCIFFFFSTFYIWPAAATSICVSVLFFVQFLRPKLFKAGLLLKKKLNKAQ